MTAYAAPVQGQTKVRPTGVTILTILYALQSIMLIVSGITLMGIGSMFGDIGSLLGSIVGIPLILIGLIGLLITFGLWKGKGWARIIAIIFAILSLLANLAGAIGLSPTSIIGLLVAVVILWYLFQPQVKAFYA